MIFNNCVRIFCYFDGRLIPLFMNILIVEDNAELAAELKDYLFTSGYICKITTNCEMALDEVCSNDYDIYFWLQ